MPPPTSSTSMATVTTTCAGACRVARPVTWSPRSAAGVPAASDRGDGASAPDGGEDVIDGARAAGHEEVHRRHLAGEKPASLLDRPGDADVAGAIRVLLDLIGQFRRDVAVERGRQRLDLLSRGEHLEAGDGG